MLLPVVARELRTAARRPWTYWGRVAAGGVALLLSIWLALVANVLGTRGNGLPLFVALSVPAMGFAFLSGLLYSADSISSEKRDGTLGLLFLTDLCGVDVTLGKLAGTSLGAIYGLVAMMPFLALTLLLGGVTGADYARMVLVLLLTLLSSLATGLLASVLCADARRSVLLAFALMVVVALGGPALHALVSWALPRVGAAAATVDQWNSGWMKIASPLAAFGYGVGPSYKTGARYYWIAVAFTGGIGALALALASWRLPHQWQEASTGITRWSFTGLLYRLRFPDLDSRTRFRRAILEANPVTWLMARHWLRAWHPWLLLAAVALVLWGIGAWQEGDWWDVDVGVALSIGVHLTFKLWMANEAPRQFLEDRRSGALELLLATPLTTAEIVSGQWRALRRQFLRPMLLVLVADFVGMGWYVVLSRDTDAPKLAVLWLLWMVLLILDLWALGWAGLWAGMIGRGRATTAWLIARVLVLPWILWFLVATFIGVMATPDTPDLLAHWLVAGSWFAIAVGTDVFWATRAKTGFASTFRQAATRTPGENQVWCRRNPASAR